MVAAIKVPVERGRSAKSDGLDSQKLAEYSAIGLLNSIAIPTEQEEADRQIGRQFEQFGRDMRRAKCRIKSFLMQHDIPEPAGLKGWSNRALRALDELQLRPALRRCLDNYLLDLNWQLGKRDELKKDLEELAASAQYRDDCELLRTIPYLGKVKAVRFLTEVFDPKRFSNSKQVANYIGVAPLVRGTGETVRNCGISRTGRAELRSLMYQAAWRWIGRDERAMAVYLRQKKNPGSSQKAITVMTRKLCTLAWSMLVHGMEYDPGRIGKGA